MRKSLLFVLVVLSGCSLFASPVPTPVPTAVPSETPTIVPTLTPSITPTITPTRTLEPFEEYTIEYLRQRTYGGGKIEMLETLLDTDTFTSYSIRYPSDGLTIYGFVNVPKGAGPFPVIISLHAYSPYGEYDVFDPSYDFAGYFAENGFIVLHPGLRNHPPSDNGDNLLRVGMSIDALNLIALVKTGREWPAELPATNTDRLGLWGMSLGGEIALRVLTISPDIKATVLYSSLTGDIERNSKQLYVATLDEQFQDYLQVPAEMFERISPVNYYDNITSAVQLNHGTEDTTVPIAWAFETCDLLAATGIPVQCRYYPARHVFNRSNFETLQPHALEFYQKYLLP